MAPHLRLARPVTDLSRTAAMYTRGLDLQVLASFTDHDGFDGVIVGHERAGYHFEFTACRAHPVAPAPTAEDLIVLYEPDAPRWQAACDRMLGAGFERVRSFNPYWDRHGATFADADGYRTVWQQASWGRVIA